MSDTDNLPQPDSQGLSRTPPNGAAGREWNQNKGAWMLQPAVRIWKDESGFIVTIELILIATIIGIGSIVGFVAVRDALNMAMQDLSIAIEKLEIGRLLLEGGSAVSGAESNAVSEPLQQASSTCIDFSQPPTDEL